MNFKVTGIAVAVVAVCTGLFIWNRSLTPKIAYVRSGVIVEKYQGMKEAKSLYKDKMVKWQSNIDTLKNDYQQVLSRYSLEVSHLSSSEKREREDLLRKQELNIRQYAGALEEKAKEEDAKLTEGVLNQINSYVKDYGEKNGYDLILGSTMDGNILYGKDAIDVTDDVLKGLNESYGTKGDKN